MGGVKFLGFNYKQFIKLSKRALPDKLFTEMMESNHIKKMTALNLNDVVWLNAIGMNIFNHTTQNDTVLDYHRRFEVDYDPAFNMTSTEVFDHRAIEIINRAVTENKKIRVMYSGGIDSTVILVAILRNIPYEEKHRIGVVMSPVSISENAYVFEKIVKDLPRDSFAKFNNKPLDEDTIFISGVSADYCFYGQADNTMYDLIDDRRLAALAESCPVECKDRAQQAHWIYLNYYYLIKEVQTLPVYSKRRSYAKELTTEESAIIDSNMVLYYEAPVFFNYVFANFDAMTTGQTNNAKSIGKDYVSDYLGEKYYRYVAVSGGDYCVMPTMKVMFAIDSNYNFYHRYDEEFITELAHKFIAAE